MFGAWGGVQGASLGARGVRKALDIPRGEWWPGRVVRPLRPKDGAQGELQVTLEGITCQMKEVALCS